MGVADKWAGKWKSSSKKLRREVRQAIHALRDKCLPVDPTFYAEATALFQPEPLRKAIRSFCRRTAIGSDKVDFYWLAELPDEAIQAICTVFSQCLQGLALPSCLLDHLLSDIPKKGAGHTSAHRGDGLAPTHISGRAYPEIRSPLG